MTIVHHTFTRLDTDGRPLFVLTCDRTITAGAYKRLVRGLRKADADSRLIVLPPGAKLERFTLAPIAMTAADLGLIEYLNTDDGRVHTDYFPEYPPA